MAWASIRVLDGLGQHPVLVWLHGHPFVDLQTTTRPDKQQKVQDKKQPKSKKDGKKAGGPMLSLYHPPTGVQTTQNSTPDVQTKKLALLLP
jgi:hypothetical protein